jgi:hypothetical protein
MQEIFIFMKFVVRCCKVDSHKLNQRDEYLLISLALMHEIPFCTVCKCLKEVFFSPSRMLYWRNIILQTNSVNSNFKKFAGLKVL